MKYCVYTFWDYPDMDKCEIYHSTQDLEEYDGFNIASSHDGVTFNIYNSLEEAIINSDYNPECIKFTDLSEEEIKEKDNILSKYVWTYENEYQVKEI